MPAPTLPTGLPTSVEIAATPTPASVPATSQLAQPVAEYAIRVRDASRNLVGEVAIQNALFTLRYNNVSAWAIQIDANDPLAGDLAADGAGIQVLRVLRDPATGQRLSGGVLFSGPRWGRVRQMQGRVLIASGYDDLLRLQGRWAYPGGTYNSGTHTYSSDYDTRTGAAETVIRGYVDANAGPSAIANPAGISRVVSGLVLDTDQGRGATVTGHARFDQLILPDGTGLLQQLAQSGGMGFRLAQIGTSLVFSQYVPTDRTASVIFSDALGNLADFSYQEDGPDFTQGGNCIAVAGAGTGAARLIIARADTDSISRWGLFEGFQDARDTSDLATMQQRGDAALAQAAVQTQFACTLAPQRAIVYGQDFSVGDVVTVVVDGVSFTNVLREVQIKLDTQGAETVTPAVGSPNADTIRQLFGGYVKQRQLTAVHRTANLLARSQ